MKSWVSLQCELCLRSGKVLISEEFKLASFQTGEREVCIAFWSIEAFCLFALERCSLQISKVKVRLCLSVLVVDDLKKSAIKSFRKLLCLLKSYQTKSLKNKKKNFNKRPNRVVFDND